MWDVFLCHSSSDLELAEKIYEAMEGSGHCCFFSNRTIPPGVTWSAAVVRGIENSKVMVLILSDAANDSDEVLREVTLASENKVSIIAFFLTTSPISYRLKYYLNSRQWLLAQNDARVQIPKLVWAVGVILESFEPQKNESASQRDPRRAACKRSSYAKYSILPTASKVHRSLPAALTAQMPHPLAVGDRSLMIVEQGTALPTTLCIRVVLGSDATSDDGTLRLSVFKSANVDEPDGYLVFHVPESLTTEPNLEADLTVKVDASRVLSALLHFPAVHLELVGKFVAESKTNQVNQERDSTLGKEPEGDFVDCTLFGPPRVETGETALLQAFVHIPERGGEAKSLAQEFDDEATRRGLTSLDMQVERGTLLLFELRQLRGVEESENFPRSVVWRGQTASVEFTLTPRACAKSVAGHVRVSQGGVPLGKVGFKIKVVHAPMTEAKPQLPESVPIGQATRYRYAFISYASEDRDEVLRRVQMLAPLKIRHFHDVMDLDPGDRWEQELYRHIDKSDVLFLFWSKAARNSEWVGKEVSYALARKTGNTDALPDIIPILLEGPPPVKPPPELADLHFNDRVLYFMDQKRE